MKKRTLVKTIQSIYIAKLLPALCLIGFAIFVFINYPLMDVLHPKTLTDISQLSTKYYSGQQYLTLKLPTAYYTGYDYMHNSEKKGSYYYSFIQDKCVFFLLNKETAKKGTTLQDITAKVKIITDHKQLDFLTEQFSTDLSWTSSELNQITEPYIISELDAPSPIAYMLIFLMGIITLFSSIVTLRSLLFISLPHLSPVCKHLGHGKTAKLALKEADLQLENNRYFYVTDMSITSNYFIELDKYHVEIIPLDTIIWAYKHSRMNKLWGVSYTLVIYSKHSISRFHHKQKYDIDFILEYLAESCPNVIIGNSKEHRILAMERFRTKG